MRKSKKIAWMLLLTAVLLLTLPVGALAHDVPDPDKIGSITLELICDGKTVTGGVFTLWRVGDIAEDDGNYSFVKSAALEAYEGALDDIADPALAESLSEYIDANSVPSVVAVYNETGTVAFSAVEPGLYLIEQTQPSENYQATAPFLVSVPQNEDGTYIYDVNAEPKIGTLAAPTPTPTPTPAGPKLPQTGQMNAPIPILAGLGVLCIIIGLALRLAKRYDDAE